MPLVPERGDFKERFGPHLLGPQVLTCIGSPASVVAAPIGTICLRVDGGANTTLYVKESGTDSSGWVAK